MTTFWELQRSFEGGVPPGWHEAHGYMHFFGDDGIVSASVYPPRDNYSTWYVDFVTDSRRHPVPAEDGRDE